MSRSLTERELLKIQIQTYDFYARLIDRAVGGHAAPKMPRWDEQRATEYQQLADQLRQRLAELEAEGTDQAVLSPDGHVPAPVQS